MLGNALIAFAGFAALCLAMEKHFSDLLGRKPRPGQLKALQVAGWLLPVLPLVLSVHLRGWADGSVAWAAVITAGRPVRVFFLPS